jgi:hypothetical protein
VPVHDSLRGPRIACPDAIELMPALAAQTGPAPTDNPFNDYHLTGIAPVEGGYSITITNKKDKKKSVIEPGSNSKFQVISVNRHPEIHLGTVVTLTDGRVQGEVRFEPTLVVLNSPNNANPQNQGQPELPPGVNPNQPNNAVPAPIITPRPRVIPPAKPNQSPANNNPDARPKRTR